jgi:hypothetical protein
VTSLNKPYKFKEAFHLHTLEAMYKEISLNKDVKTVDVTEESHSP